MIEESQDGGPTMIDLSSIEQADVLRGLTKPDLAELGAIASEQEFRRRDCLFERGQEAKTFYIATRGRFALTVPLRVLDRQESLAVEEKGARDAFGWSSLVKPRRSIYSCYCIEDGAAVAFPREQLAALMTTNSRLGEEFLHSLNNLIAARVRLLQELWLDEVSQSMARVQHWTRTELSVQFFDAMIDPSSRGAQSWIRRHMRLEART
jgi:CRP-like cAMP-binding protein